MKKILGLILYAALMFGVTAGLGMFMMKKTAPHGNEHAEGNDDHGTAEHFDADHGESAIEIVRTADASISQGHTAILQRLIRMQMRRWSQRPAASGCCAKLADECRRDRPHGSESEDA